MLIKLAVMTYLFLKTQHIANHLECFVLVWWRETNFPITLVSSFLSSFQREIPRYLPKFGPDILVLEIYFLLYPMQICKGARTGISDIIFTLNRALAPEIFCYYSSGSGCCSHTSLFISGIQQVISTLESLYYQTGRDSAGSKTVLPMQDKLPQTRNSQALTAFKPIGTTILVSQKTKL